MGQQKSGDLVGPMGMEHDGNVFSLDGHHRVDGFSGLFPPLPYQIDAATRQEKFHESPGIGQKGMDEMAFPLT